MGDHRVISLACHGGEEVQAGYALLLSWEAAGPQADLHRPLKAPCGERAIPNAQDHPFASHLSHPAISCPEAYTV
jgi:hypothetical protein